jgi:hypothetical protein
MLSTRRAGAASGLRETYFLQEVGLNTSYLIDGGGEDSSGGEDPCAYARAQPIDDRFEAANGEPHEVHLADPRARLSAGSELISPSTIRTFYLNEDLATTLADPDQLRCSKRFGSARLFSRRYPDLGSGKHVVVIDVIDFPLEHAGRRALARAAWIVLTNEDFPRLTSC